MRTKLPTTLIAAYIHKEMDLSEIAAEIGKSTTTVYNALVAESISTNAHRRRFEERNKRMLEMYKKVKNLREVGEEFQVTKERARQIIHRLDPTVIKRR